MRLRPEVGVAAQTDVRRVAVLHPGAVSRPCCVAVAGGRALQPPVSVKRAALQSYRNLNWFSVAEPVGIKSLFQFAPRDSHSIFLFAVTLLFS